MGPMSDILARVRQSGRVSAEDTQAVRRIVYPDMYVDKDEVEALFAIDETAHRRDPQWVSFFLEALSDFLVRQTNPIGYISEANARWLMKHIDRDGEVKTETELMLLVKILEEADHAPEPLFLFAMDQIRMAVLEGRGPLARDSRLEPGRVNAAEAALLRRVIYAYGSDGGAAITRAEAEILFDINDAVADADNDPDWTDLFAKALANFLMAASGYSAPSREVALARDEWLGSGSTDVAGFVGRMASSGFSGILNAYRQPSARQVMEKHNDRMAADIAASETVTRMEAEWLAARLRRDGELSESEKVLLRFIKENSPDIHPALKPLIDAA